MNRYEANPTSRAKIRRVTSFIREVLDLSDEEYFPIDVFLEWGMPQIDKDFNFEVIECTEMQEYAITFPEKKIIYIREDVYENCLKGIPRDRFTIAHEIGHYLLHTPGNIKLARTNSKDKLPAYKDPEWQANTFAAELLAPPSLLAGLSIDEIFLRFGVSKQVADIQMKHCS